MSATKQHDNNRCDTARKRRNVQCTNSRQVFKTGSESEATKKLLSVRSQPVVFSDPARKVSDFVYFFSKFAS